MAHVTWHSDRGYGFIRPGGGSGDVFVHISEFVGLAPSPATEIRVLYNISTDKKGRTQAINVRSQGSRATLLNAPFETAIAGSTVLIILCLTA